MAPTSESAVESAASVEALEPVAKKPSPCSISNRNFAVLICSVFVGGYSFFLEAAYKEIFFYEEVRSTLYISSAFNQLAGVVNLALILALLADENVITKFALGKVMYVSGVLVFVSLYTITMTLTNCMTITLWELPRFATLLMHLRLSHRRLLQLKEEMSPPPQPIRGWLKSNLANLGPSTLKDIDSIVKVHKKTEKKCVHETAASVP